MIRQLQNAGPTLKIILGAMLVIICASMAITLIPGGIGSSLGIGAPPAGVLATIGDQTVTVPEVQREARIMIRQQFPKGGPQASMLLPYFASQAAERLISEKTQVAEAHHLGLRVSDDELREELQHGPLAPTLFPDGKFIGQEEYENLLQRNDLTVPMFEAQVKEDILTRKLRALVSGSAFVGDTEVRDEFNRRNTKVKFEYAVITQADILKGLHPTDEELKAFYDRNKATYNNSIPEKRRIEYVVVDSAKIAGATTVTDQDLQAYYDQHRDEYRVPEQVKVTHILIKTPLPAPGAKEDEKAIADARAKAEDVLKQVKAGGDFAKLAEKYSDDPGSAKSGGELGWIGRGRTVPEFEKAAFSLSKGQTSDLVKSSYGFHIIRVEDKQNAHLKTLAEVKSEIEEKVKQGKTAHATEAAANALLSQARTDGFDKAPAAKGQAAVTTDFFGRTDNLPGLAANPQFMEAVFNETEKAPPDLVQVPQGYVVFQLLAIKPPATPTFEDIRSRVESEFKNERAGFLLHQKTQELSDRAKAGHDLKKAAKDLGATVKTSDLVLPDGQVPDIGSMSSASAIFSLKPGEISGPITAGGNGVVAQLLEKQPPTDQEFAEKKDGIRQSLLEAKQNDLFGLFVTNLRRDMEKSKQLKVNQEEMKNLTRQGGEEGS
ncbi:MAG TPA: peptidyl-prolyl cis-trans isomerase [Terriglobales bacterium]|jgi:peptidyl-prolyl cis-trans isomerase D|nr:peptidyl-prolyl cis-trans isomerase [Terriglobales bacterium]